MAKWIVRHKPSSNNVRRKAHRRIGCRRTYRSRITEQSPRARVEIVEAPDHFTAADFCGDPSVLSAAPDQIVRLLETPGRRIPSDPLYPRQWDLPDMRAPEAWYYGTTSDVVVAVIDTGVDYTHPELRPQLWHDPARAPGDALYHGCGFRDGATMPPMDDNGHGTHVAGTIAARANDGTGVAGLIWSGAQIMAVKFLDRDGSGYLSDAILAVNYAIEHGAKILQNSWGGSVRDASLEEVWRAAGEHGAICVCAAGNSAWNNDFDFYFAPVSYPASYRMPHNVSVAAHTPQRALAFFSNYGRRSVHLSAPGTEILSLNVMPSERHGYGDYEPWSGTSMSSPHVAGACALFWAAAPAATNLQVVAYVLGGTTTEEYWPEYLVTGALLDAYRPIQYLTGPVPLETCESVADLRVEESPTDPQQIDLHWRLPEGATGTVICASHVTYPQEIIDDVIYTGAGTSCSDTLQDTVSPRYYSAWAVYPGGRHSLPLRQASRIRTDFYCPEAPPGVDFICNFWDEDWLPYRSLLDAHVFAQFWRGLASKGRTHAYGYDPHEPDGRFFDAPKTVGALREIMFRDYPRAQQEHFEDRPNGHDVMETQSRSEVALFLLALYRELNKLRRATCLYSPVFAREMEWTWLDYWHYRDTGEIRTWRWPAEYDETYSVDTPADAERTWDRFRSPQNWLAITTLARRILHNLRVLYTMPIPWYVFTIGDIRAAHATMTRVEPDEVADLRVWYHRHDFDHGDAPMRTPNTHAIDGLPKDPIYTFNFAMTQLSDPMRKEILYYSPDDFRGALGIFRIPSGVDGALGLMISKGWDADARTWFYPPRAPDGTRPYAPTDLTLAAARLPEVAYPEWSVDTEDAPLHFPQMLFDSLDPKWVWQHGSVTGSLWSEWPTRLSDDGSNYVWPRVHSRYYHNDIGEFHRIDVTAERCAEMSASRSLLEFSSRLYLPGSWDWASIPVRITFTFVCISGESVAQLGIGKRIMYRGIEPMVHPTRNEEGTLHVYVQGDHPDCARRDFDINPTAIYKMAGHTLREKIWEVTINTNGDHYLGFRIHTELATDTLPACVYEAKNPRPSTSHETAPAAAYALTRDGVGTPAYRWRYTDMAPRGEYSAYTQEQFYGYQNCRGLEMGIEMKLEIIT